MAKRRKKPKSKAKREIEITQFSYDNPRVVRFVYNGFSHTIDIPVDVPEEDWCDYIFENHAYLKANPP